jgi:hypothetical protein
MLLAPGDRNQWIMDYQDDQRRLLIVSGTVSVKLQLVSGREVLLREINAGEFFGELAAIDNQPRFIGDRCRHRRDPGAYARIGLPRGGPFALYRRDQRVGSGRDRRAAGWPANTAQPSLWYLFRVILSLVGGSI